MQSAISNIAMALAFAASAICLGAAAPMRPVADVGAAFAAPANGRDPLREFSDGVTALQANRFDQAAALLQQASQDSPENADIWRFLGVARAGLKDWSGSQTAYEKAVRLNSNDLASHAGLAMALIARNDPQAKTELDWLGDRVKTCGGKCPDGDYLSTMYSQVQDAAAGRGLGPVL